MFNIELLQAKSKMQNIKMKKEENIRNKKQNLKNLRKNIKKIANGAADFALGTIAATIVGITMGATYQLSEKNLLLLSISPYILIIDGVSGAQHTINNDIKDTWIYKTFNKKYIDITSDSWKLPPKINKPNVSKI